MEIHQLRSFVGVAEEGGFCKAAAALGVAQPSLSQHIQRLEKHLGRSLFDRLGRQTVLTEAGRSLLPKAKRILAEMREIEEDAGADDATDRPHRLVVGAIPTIAPYLLPGVIRALVRPTTKTPLRHEIVIREDVTDRLVPAVVNAEVEVAIISAPVQDDRIEVEHLQTEPFMVAVPADHAWAKRASIPLALLDHEDLIVLHEEHCFGRQLAAVCAGIRITPKAHSATASLRTALEMVAAGVGITVVPATCAAGSRGVGCVFVPLSGRPPAARDISLAWRKGRTRSAAAGRFAAEVAARLSEALSGKQNA